MTSFDRPHTISY